MINDDLNMRNNQSDKEFDDLIDEYKSLSNAYKRVIDEFDRANVKQKFGYIRAPSDLNFRV